MYAIRDFYQSLGLWPGKQDVTIAPLTTGYTLDRGRAWDSFLHHLSENLIIIRGLDHTEGSLAFGRSVREFSGFNVRERHHVSLARLAQAIEHDADEESEYIAQSTARQMAYEQGADEPSAYDLVILCNFLTQHEMVSRFDRELRALMSSLTPGGLLIVMGGIGAPYPELYSTLRAMAAAARLLDVSPAESFNANNSPELLSIVGAHVRENVMLGLSQCSPEVREAILSQLPRDVVDNNIPFKLPRFQGLIFVNQGPSSRERRKRGRALGRSE